MNVRDRRGLNVGVVLVGLGIFFILRRELHIPGPAPILLVIGAILFTFAAIQGFRGPVVPACVLLGLGVGFLLRDPLDDWMPRWSAILLGLGAGLLLAAGIDRRPSHEVRPTLVPGIVLVAIAARGGSGDELPSPCAREPGRECLAPLALGARRRGSDPRDPGDPKDSPRRRSLSPRRDPTTEGRPPAVGNAVQSTAFIVSRPKGGRRFAPRERSAKRRVRPAVEPLWASRRPLRRRRRPGAQRERRV